MIRFCVLCVICGLKEERSMDLSRNLGWSVGCRIVGFECRGGPAVLVAGHGRGVVRQYGTGGVWVVVTNLGVVRGNPDRVQSEVRGDFVAQSAESLVYDGDGNLVRDGRWEYSWWAEKRLGWVMSHRASDRASWRRVDWVYDALGRRIRQTSYVLSNGVWVVTEDLKSVSDPVWFGRHIAELNATNHAVVRSYVWGLDLSETLDGAGGVGGLLWVRMASGPASGTHFATYDGNGNVWQLVSASTGTATARYEYGPFGEPLRTTGPMVKENPFRFSAKYQDGETDLLYYGYRYYNPSTGRRLSRDPIEERGGRNLYGFCRNDAVARLDSPGQNDLAFCGPMMTGEVEWHTPSELEVEISLLMAALMTPVPGDEGLAAAVLTKRLAKLLNKGGKCLRCRCRVGWHGKSVQHNYCHLQLACCGKGVSMSHRKLRIPLPDKLCPPGGRDWNWP